MNTQQEIYEIATDLLEDIWVHINWDNIKPGRRIKIWNEFENQIKALSKCNSRLEPFIDKICKRFDSYVSSEKTKDILILDHDELLNIYRNETQIPVLLLRLRREDKKK